MASLIELLGSQKAVDEAKEAARTVLQSAIASAFGNLEIEEPKLLAPVRKMADDWIDATLPKLRTLLDKWVDDTILKVTKLKVTKGE